MSGESEGWLLELEVEGRRELGGLLGWRVELIYASSGSLETALMAGNEAIRLLKILSARRASCRRSLVAFSTRWQRMSAGRQ